MFPSSLLSRLFVKGTLKNTPNGFAFSLKNIIESGTITGLGRLTVDDTSYEPSALTVRIGEKEMAGDTITRATPLQARAMVEISVRVQGQPLSSGEHKITIQILTAEAGKIAFTVTDTVAE